MSTWRFQHYDNVKLSDARLSGTTRCEYGVISPFLFSPAFELPATGDDTLVIRIKSARAGAGQLLFKRVGETAYNDAQKIKFHTPGGDGRWHILIVPLKHGEWKGVITHLRLVFLYEDKVDINITDISLLKLPADRAGNLIGNGGLDIPGDGGQPHRWKASGDGMSVATGPGVPGRGRAFRLVGAGGAALNPDWVYLDFLEAEIRQTARIKVVEGRGPRRVDSSAVGHVPPDGLAFSGGQESVFRQDDQAVLGQVAHVRLADNVEQDVAFLHYPHEVEITFDFNRIIAETRHGPRRAAGIVHPPDKLAPERGAAKHILRPDCRLDLHGPIRTAGKRKRQGPAFRLADVFGVHFAGGFGEKLGYITPIAEGFPAEDDVMLGFRQVHIRAEPDATVLGVRTAAISQPEELARFGSALSCPPEKPGVEPAVVRHRFGKGLSVYCAGSLEYENFDFRPCRGSPVGAKILNALHACKAHPNTPLHREYLGLRGFLRRLGCCADHRPRGHPIHPPVHRRAEPRVFRLRSRSKRSGCDASHGRKRLAMASRMGT